MPAPPALFSPFDLRKLSLSNRIVVSPMGQHSAVDGLPVDWHLMHLGQFAVSGAGLAITEAIAVAPHGRISRGCLGLWSDEQARALGRIAEFYAEYGGAKFGVQLSHAGRKGSVTTAWEGQTPVLPQDGGWPIWSASAAAYPGRTTPEPLDRDGMIAARNAFADATRRSHVAGFELIEIHAAHGYLLHNFLSPLTNQRDDDYGGSLENRMRFPLEVFEAVRAAWPADKPLGVRVSATDWIPGGWEIEDTLAFSEALKARGCDFICASTGGTAPAQQIPVGPRYQVPFARRIREEIGIPTMAVGLILEPEDAQAIVAEGDADLVALGRGMLHNPRWAWHAAERLGAEAFFPVQYDRVHPSMRRNDTFKVKRERG